MAASQEAERREGMAFQGINPTIVGLFTPTCKPNDNKIRPAQGVTTDGFSIWWQKTIAQHTVMVAQASALVRAHRRVNSVDGTYIGRTR